jgi:integrase
MATPLRLQTREARKKLVAREDPYWYELRRGLALGYVRGAEGGYWRLREYRNGRYSKRRIGLADDDVAADGSSVLSWEDAQRVALGDDRPTVTKPGKYTVAQAAEAYFDFRAKRSSTAGDRLTYRAVITAEREGIPKLGERSIADLTTAELNRWLSALVPETADRELRRRAQATANRHRNLLWAILNFAYSNEPSRVPSADAWRRVKPYKDVDQPRTRTLSKQEAIRLLNSLSPMLRSLARGALYTGCRLGELLELRVQDVADGQVTISYSKSGKRRHIPLSDEGATFFEQALAGKLGDARVFETVSKIKVSRAMRAACLEAKISPPATFHDLRRSYGSLMLNSGAADAVIQELLGHADPRMTRRAYAHLKNKTLKKAVNKHLPSFGLEESTVMPLRASSRKAKRS